MEHENSINIEANNNKESKAEEVKEVKHEMYEEEMYEEDKQTTKSSIVKITMLGPKKSGKTYMLSAKSLPNESLQLSNNIKCNLFPIAVRSQVRTFNTSFLALHELALHDTVCKAKGCETF